MRLIQKHQRVFRQIVDQGRRCLARTAPGEVARVVLDALAETDLGHHLQIEAGALLDALRLHQLVLGHILVDARAQFELDRLHRAQRGLARGHIVAAGIHREARHLLADMPGQRIEQLQALDLVVEQ